MDTIGLLIIGPLLLILLIGWAYSGDSIHSVRFGVITDDFVDVSDVLLDKFYRFGSVYRYHSTSSCIRDVKRERVHICLEFSDDFVKYKNGNKVPSGIITFHYDNSRKKITDLIIEGLENILGVASEEISIKSTEALLSNVQEMIVFIGEKRSDIDDAIGESEEIRDGLILRKQKLENVQDDFSPAYEKLKTIQDELNTLHMSNPFNKINNEINTLKWTVDGLGFWLDAAALDLDTTSADFSSQTYYYISGYDGMGNPLYSQKYFSTYYLDQTSIKLKNLKDKLDDLSTSLNSGSENIVFLDDQFDDLILQFNILMDQIELINDMLEQEIQTTDDYIKKMDKAIIKLTDIAEKLDADLETFAGVSPDQAASFVKPISYSFESLLNVKSIALLFPMLLVIVITFISLLFSNIVTLSEINSKSFFRNLITPVSQFDFTLGLVITNLIIVLFQVLVLFFVAEFSFAIPIFNGLLLDSLLVCSVLILIFVFLGMSFAYFFENQQTSILITTLFALGFFLFSATIAPLEVMPKSASLIASFNPVVIGESIFRKIFLFHFAPLIYAFNQFLQLVGYSVVGIIILMFSIRSYKKRI